MGETTENQIEQVTEEERRLRDLYYSSSREVWALLKELLLAPDDASILTSLLSTAKLAFQYQEDGKMESVRRKKRENAAANHQRHLANIERREADRREKEAEKQMKLAKTEERLAQAELARQLAEKKRQAHAEMLAQQCQTKEDSKTLKTAKKSAVRERADLLKEQAEADRLLQLALQGRKKAIVQIALASGDLEEITEDRIQAVANAQRRSNGGLVRIESGSGK